MPRPPPRPGQPVVVPGPSRHHRLVQLHPEEIVLIAAGEEGGGVNTRLLPEGSVVGGIAGVRVGGGGGGEGAPALLPAETAGPRELRQFTAGCGPGPGRRPAGEGCAAAQHQAAVVVGVGVAGQGGGRDGELAAGTAPGLHLLQAVPPPRAAALLAGPAALAATLVCAPQCNAVTLHIAPNQ